MRNNVSTLLGKLEVADRAEAIARAGGRGWVRSRADGSDSSDSVRRMDEDVSVSPRQVYARAQRLGLRALRGGAAARGTHPARRDGAAARSVAGGARAPQGLPPRIARRAGSGDGDADRGARRGRVVGPGDLVEDDDLSALTAVARSSPRWSSRRRRRWTHANAEPDRSGDRLALPCGAGTGRASSRCTEPRRTRTTRSPAWGSATELGFAVLAVRSSQRTSPSYRSWPDQERAWGEEIASRPRDAARATCGTCRSSRRGSRRADGSPCCGHCPRRRGRRRRGRRGACAYGASRARTSGQALEPALLIVGEERRPRATTSWPRARPSSGAGFTTDVVAGLGHRFPDDFPRRAGDGAGPRAPTGLTEPLVPPPPGPSAQAARGCQLRVSVRLLDDEPIVVAEPPYLTTRTCLPFFSLGEGHHDPPLVRDRERGPGDDASAVRDDDVPVGTDVAETTTVTLPLRAVETFHVALVVDVDLVASGGLGADRRGNDRCRRVPGDRCRRRHRSCRGPGVGRRDGLDVARGVRGAHLEPVGPRDQPGVRHRGRARGPRARTGRGGQPALVRRGARRGEGEGRPVGRRAGVEPGRRGDACRPSSGRSPASPACCRPGRGPGATAGAHPARDRCIPGCEEHGTHEPGPAGVSSLHSFVVASLVWNVKAAVAPSIRAVMLAVGATVSTVQDHSAGTESTHWP